MRIPWSERGSSTRSGRGSPLGGRRKWRLLLVPAMGIAVVCQLSLTGTAGAATAATAAATAKTVTAGAVAPNAANELDCNGWSKAYATVRKLASARASTRSGVKNGKRFRFEDNGHYIGHDEPSVKFISSSRGSGNTMSYLTKMPVDPRKSPTPTGKVTNYGQLSVAPWFGLPMCDPNSYPQNALHPGQRHQHRSGSADRRRLRVHGAPVLPAGLHPVRRQRELQRDQVVRGAQHRQPRVLVQLRHLQQQLHRAGQLRVPADQRRPGRSAEPAARGRQHLAPQPQHADDQRR